jgi:CRP-like cAMP-binding protein
VNDTSTQIRKAAESYFGVELTDESLGEFVVCEIGGGDWLFHQGEIGSSLFLLVRGRFIIFIGARPFARAPGNR